MAKAWVLLFSLLVLGEASWVKERGHEEPHVVKPKARRTTGTECPKSEVPANIQRLFVSAHNDLRESIAQGTEGSANGLLPTAKNMYIVKWDCSLEKKAQEAAAKCSDSSASGENTEIVTGGKNDASTIATTLLGWRMQLAKADLGTGLKYSSKLKIQKWANMAFSSTTQIGCAVHSCSKGLAVSCVYSASGDVEGQAIYESGKSCQYDADCTKHSHSHCVPLRGVCYEESEEQKDAHHMCPSNSKMMDDSRVAILDYHNSLRSSLAHGLQRDATGSAPMGKAMSEMDYDCELEKQAQKAVETCNYTPSQRGKGGENGYVIEDENNQIKLLQMAAQKWWSEIEDMELSKNTTFSYTYLAHSSTHFSQMAWSTTTRVGCATKVCGHTSLVSCLYSPRGNHVGQLIYEVGKPCRKDGDCDKGKTCAKTEGLCTTAVH